MARHPILSVEEVQEFIRDRAENNHLIDGAEFNPTVVTLAMDLAISSYNMIPPISVATVETFPSKSLLMMGTIAKMFAGQAALKARNTMNYNDGGIQIPVEEQFQLYQALAAMYGEEFEKSAKLLKMHLNVEEGWGSVNSDYSRFPEF